MGGRHDLGAAAELFKLLGSRSRLELLVLLSEGERTVTDLVQESGLPQPLVSQHLRTLRQGHLVAVEREGRHAVYRLADEHVVHVLADAVAHSHEPTEGLLTPSTPQEPLP